MLVQNQHKNSSSISTEKTTQTLPQTFAINIEITNNFNSSQIHLEWTQVASK